MIFEQLEDKAGHDLCHVAGPAAGISTYYCEGCGALVQLLKDEVRLFHVPAGSTSIEGQCSSPTMNPHGESPLRTKLQVLMMAEFFPHD